jgi:copper homeostasis protein
MTRIEICVEGAAGVAAARAAGADRVELSAALDVGGLTPSAGLMRVAVESGIAARALIRPRAGAFDYDADEIGVIDRDIAAARALGLDGVVFGAAGAEGALDRDLIRRWADQSGPLGKTLHRVFDLTPDPFEALETAIEAGFDHILTSGQARSAAEGVPMLARLARAAGGRITIMAAGGLTPENVAAVVGGTGVGEVHASCRAPDLGDSAALPFGFGRRPAPVDAGRLKALVHAVRQAGGSGAGR